MHAARPQAREREVAQHEQRLREAPDLGVAGEAVELLHRRLVRVRVRVRYRIRVRVKVRVRVTVRGKVRVRVRV